MVDSKDILETLLSARKLIANPARWTTKVCSRNTAGNRVQVFDANATCWCALGAVYYVSQNDIPLYQSTLEFIEDKHKEELLEECQLLLEFNDSRTHEEVVEMFDKAIELARQEVL